MAFVLYISLFKCLYNVCIYTSHFFLQYEPEVHPEAAAHVHHMLLYECPLQVVPLIKDVDLNGAACFRTPLGYCLGGTLLAAWAVGGKVSLLITVFHIGLTLFQTH